MASLCFAFRLFPVGCVDLERLQRFFAEILQRIHGKVAEEPHLHFEMTVGDLAVALSPTDAIS